MPTNFFLNESAVSKGSVRVVDVSEEPDEAVILRNGYQVPQLELDKSLVADFVANDKLDNIKIQPRVVSQSISAGTRITRGTSVDIVLANPFLLDGKFIPGSHRDTAELSLGNIAENFLVDDDIRSIVQRTPEAEKLPEEVRTQFEQTAEQQGIIINNDIEGQDMTSLYRAILAANTFN